MENKQMKEEIVEEIKNNKWDSEFKELCGAGLGLCRGGLTKGFTIGQAELLRQEDLIQKAHRIIVRKERRRGE